MLYPEKTIYLKNDLEALLRSPCAKDAAPMIEYLKTCYGQTPFLLQYPDEFTITPEQEEGYLENLNRSPNNLMIVCDINGEIAGNCQLTFHTKRKTMHRADVAIALVEKYWGLGIGTALFGEMIAVAREHGATQLELEVIEGNERAIGLYKKMGFEIVGANPDAIHLDDGRKLQEFFMVKAL